MSEQNARYYTEGFTSEELKDYYIAMLAFWKSINDERDIPIISYFSRKLKEIEQ